MPAADTPLPVLSFGSLNIDHVYQLDHIVRPGETTSASAYAVYPGGKGLNQSLAMARAGLPVCHAGRVGGEGLWLCDVLAESGVNCGHIVKLDGAHTGHAIIQVAGNGQNSIVLYGGANQGWTEAAITRLFAQDWRAIVCQNEMNGLPILLRCARKKNIPVIFNAAPYSTDLEIAEAEFHSLHSLLVNETEAMELAGRDDIAMAFAELKIRYPNVRLVLTLGEAGLQAAYRGRDYLIPAFPAKLVDTTAAGDTFAGYYAASILGQFPGKNDLETALLLGSRAAALAVSRAGAAPSIPYRGELQEKFTPVLH